MSNIFDLIDSNIQNSDKYQKSFLIQLKLRLTLYDDLTEVIIHEILDTYIDRYRDDHRVVLTLKKLKQFDEIDNGELEKQVSIAIHNISATGPEDLRKLMHHLKTSMSGSADGRRVYQKASYLLYNLKKCS